MWVRGGLAGIVQPMSTSHQDIMRSWLADDLLSTLHMPQATIACTGIRAVPWQAR